MCVCGPIYVYIYICVCVCVFLFICVFLCLLIYLFVYLVMHEFVCVCVRVHMSWIMITCRQQYQNAYVWWYHIKQNLEVEDTVQYIMHHQHTACSIYHISYIIYHIPSHTIPYPTTYHTPSSYHHSYPSIPYPITSHSLSQHVSSSLVPDISK